jgi:hypothetical protein
MIDLHVWEAHKARLMDDLDTFEGWRKHHGYDIEASEEQLAIWRANFDVSQARRQAARAAVFFSQPCPTNEYRYAVRSRKARIYGLRWQSAGDSKKRRTRGNASS